MRGGAILLRRHEIPQKTEVVGIASCELHVPALPITDPISVCDPRMDCRAVDGSNFVRHVKNFLLLVSREIGQRTRGAQNVAVSGADHANFLFHH